MVDKDIRTAVDEPKRPVGSKKSSKKIHDPIKTKRDTVSNSKINTKKVDDAITNGRTMTGSKPDQIVINPVFEKINSDFETFATISELDEIYNNVTSKQDQYTGSEKPSKNPNDSSSRFIGTNSITNVYKAATPGQQTDNIFALKFQDPQHDKEAITRSGQPRKQMDLTPRHNQDRKKDSSFYRQQAIVNRRVQESNFDQSFDEAFGKSRSQGKGYKSPWDKIEKAKPGIGKRIDTAVAGIRQAVSGEKQSEKTNEDYVPEVSHNLLHSFTSHMLAKHPDAVSPLKAKTKKDKMRADALQLAMDKDLPRSAIHKPHVVATEENLHEVGDTPKGRELLQTLKMRAIARAAHAAGPEITSHKDYNPEVMKRNNKVAAAHKRLQQPPAGMNKMSDKQMYGEDLAMTKKAGLINKPDKHPVEVLKDTLDNMKNPSKEDIDLVMTRIANKNNIGADLLHKMWIDKYSITPDKYVKEEKEVWDTPNPNKHHSKMTPAEKARAKAKAKAAGRPYPNLVDNMAAMKEEIDDMFEEFAGCPINEESDVDGIVEESFIFTGNELYEDWGEPEEDVTLRFQAPGDQSIFEERKVKLGKPFLTPGGPKKRAVYVKNDKGNIVKVNFGDPHLSIKRDQPTRRASYRARHHCENPGPRWKANYWSCKYWSSTPTSQLDKGATNEDTVLGMEKRAPSPIIHDAAGKPMRIKSVQFRGVDGKLRTLPPGKSRSSER